MKILLPLDLKDKQEGKLAKLDAVVAWAVVDFIEGKTTHIELFDSQEEIQEYLDVIVVKDSNEYIWPYMEQNMAILVAPMQRYIEDIMEAFLFKELHDISI